MKQIKINEKDNVAVMLEGELSGHKIALNDIKKGENIIKYGYRSCDRRHKKRRPCTYA